MPQHSIKIFIYKKSILKITFTQNAFEDWKCTFLSLKSDLCKIYFIWTMYFFKAFIIKMKDLTQVLNGVVSLLVVHFNGLGVRAADPIADSVTPHHNVLVLRGRPTHYYAVYKWPNVQGAWGVWHSCLWNQRTSNITLCHSNQALVLTRSCLFLPSRSLSNVSAVVQSVAGPVPLTVMADTRNIYSVPRWRPGIDKTNISKGFWFTMVLQILYIFTSFPSWKKNSCPVSKNT